MTGLQLFLTLVLVSVLALLIVALVVHIIKDVRKAREQDND